MAPGSLPALSAEKDSPEQEMIKYLRNEAFNVRDCFTRYSVHTLAASAALLVAIAKFQVETPYIGFLALFPILLLFQISGMGVHKYETSNRLLGYELHLQRINRYPKDRCSALISTVGWEESMRAWRLIQPTLWEQIYAPRGRLASILAKLDEKLAPSFSLKLPKRFGVIAIRPETEALIVKALSRADRKSSGFWFDQDRTIKGYGLPGVVYYAGGYLSNMMYTLSLAVVLCFALAAAALIQTWKGSPQSLLENLTLTVMLLAIGTMIVAGQISIYSRIKILESGLLSIHSCAILWEATILAHLLALEKLQIHDHSLDRPKSMHGYTRHLSESALSIAQNVASIHDWIEQARKALETTIAASNDNKDQFHLFEFPQGAS